MTRSPCLLSDVTGHRHRPSSEAIVTGHGLVGCTPQVAKEEGLSRILIVDWDVHHGNGTQDIFYEDKSVPALLRPHADLIITMASPA